MRTVRRARDVRVSLGSRPVKTNAVLQSLQVTLLSGVADTGHSFSLLIS